MAHQASSGSIYDLGYRPYDGIRLGRTYAITSLFWYSLRGIFGLGRSTMAKVFPFALAVFAVIPAIIQIAIAAVAPADFTLIRAENHFTYTQIIISLFCAVAAPDLIGRDQRSRTLTLYFSRALSRSDYVTAKLLSLFVALLILTLLPQLLLLVGEAVAQDRVLSYLGDNIGDLPPIFASCLAVSAVLASVTLAVASQSSRRAISTIAVLGAVIISFTMANILTGTLDSIAGRAAFLLSPVTTLEGLIYWFFGATPEFDSNLERADLSGFVFLLAAAAYVILFLGYLYRRFRRIAV